MLTPEQLLEIAEGAEDIAEKLHNRAIQQIVKRIATRLARGDDYILTPVDKWQLESLQEAGYLVDDLQKEIATLTRLQEKEIAEAFTWAAVQTIKYDSAIYEAAGIATQSFAQSPYLIQLMERNFNTTLREWENFTHTMPKRAHRAYIQACDSAYHAVSSGVESYTSAFKTAVDEIAGKGVSIIDYDSGHHDTIETATLRALRTGISQMAAEITTARMNEYNWDIVLVSAHLGARIGDEMDDFTNHAWWQGKFYSRSGSDKRFPPFSVCGEGEIQGICGANCRHSYGPGDGVHNPYKHYDSEENKQAYLLSQRQRVLERRIRKTKRSVLGFKAAVDAAEDPEEKAAAVLLYDKKAALLKKQNAAYNSFCDENELKRRAERVAIAQWDRHQAASATAAARRYEKVHK